MMEERQTIIGLGCGAVSKVVYPRNGAANDEQPQKIERLPNPKEPSVYNSAYKDYVARKIKLLDEAYGIERVNHFFECRGVLWERRNKAGQQRRKRPIL